MERSPIRHLAAVFILSAACGGLSPGDEGVDELTSARKVHCTTDAQCRQPQVCGPAHFCIPKPPGPPPACRAMDDCGGGALCESGACVAMACENRAPGKTGIRATVQITRYQGLQHGRNGDHEIAFGTVTALSWVHDAATIDTRAVQLAMNVSSNLDPAGLPREIPLAPGQVLQLEGEYISAAAAGASGTAVVHFTHSTCGYVTIAGTTYQ